MTAEAGKLRTKMKITIEFDSSESHDVGAVIVALAASDVKYEAAFKLVEGVTGEADAELPTELVQPLDQAAANAALLEAVYPLWSDEDDDGHEGGDDDPLEAPYLPFSQQ